MAPALYAPDGTPYWVGSFVIPGLGQMAQNRPYLGPCVLAVTLLQYILDWRTGLKVHGFFACEALIWHLYQDAVLHHGADRRG